MFARHVSLHFKPNSVGEFSRTMEKEIIPVLRKQRGFQGETWIGPSGQARSPVRRRRNDV
jgi:hypothetical protein